MSHFTVIVLAPKSEDPEAAVERMLEPYNENNHVAPYETDCWCVGRIAEHDARDAADSAHGTMHSIRQDFWKNVVPRVVAPMTLKEYNDLINRSYSTELSDDDRAVLDSKSEAIDAAWKAAISPWTATKESAAKSHPLYNRPDKSCGECHGSGRYTTTYNPHSKWDWWQIGGRWHGSLRSYDPTGDMRNYETCKLCGGTGKRTDMTEALVRVRKRMLRGNPVPGSALPAFVVTRLAKKDVFTVDSATAAAVNATEFSAADAEAYLTEYLQNTGCNGCGGKGISLKFHSEWENQGDDYIDAAAWAWSLETREGHYPFALVTPDGSWHEKGKMGWFGAVSNGMVDGDWYEALRGLAKAHITDDSLQAILVDCHI